MSSTAFWPGCNESPSYRDSARFCSVGIGFKNRLAQVFPFGEKSSTIRKNSTKPYLALLSHLHIESPKRSSWCTHVQASGSAIKKIFSISSNSSHILPTFGLPAIPTVPLFGGAQMAERRTTDQHYIIWAAWLLLQRGFPVRVLETCSLCDAQISVCSVLPFFVNYSPTAQWVPRNA